MEFEFSERRILGDLYRAVFDSKICFFWAQNSIFSAEFAFSERGILEGLDFRLGDISYKRICMYVFFFGSTQR